MHVYNNSVSYMRNSNFRVLKRPTGLYIAVWFRNIYLGDIRFEYKNPFQNPLVGSYRRGVKAFHRATSLL